MSNIETNFDIGVIGLAVMGQNLVLNLHDHGHRVMVYNRSYAKTETFIKDRAQNTSIKGVSTLQSFVAHLSKPRKVMLMVKAGEVVDEMIEKILPLLSLGDILIDGGNSHFEDTQRRYVYLNDLGFHFIGMGVSGGEEGARHGPSLMPGGDFAAWPHVDSMFQSIAAKTPSAEVCCQWLGHGGAGHFVKMVHNGIEYADMQLIGEIYDFAKTRMGYTNFQLSEMFARWNQSTLESYLVEITANILKFEAEDGMPVDYILDIAGQKGTGKWTVINALNLGATTPLIAESVFARSLSAQKALRCEVADTYHASHTRLIESRPKIKDGFENKLESALLFAKIMAYVQGYLLLKDASEEYKWALPLGDIALLWRAGCIIRSRLLDKIKQAFVEDPNLSTLMVSPYFHDLLTSLVGDARDVLVESVRSGLSMPCLSAALSFYDAIQRRQSPANLLQAQRDYFGAHMYERVDRTRGKFFHTDWIGSMGAVASSVYKV